LYAIIAAKFTFLSAGASRRNSPEEVQVYRGAHVTPRRSAARDPVDSITRAFTPKKSASGTIFYVAAGYSSIDG